MQRSTALVRSACDASEGCLTPVAVCRHVAVQARFEPHSTGTPRRTGMDWAKYRTTTYDELIQADGQPRPAARRLVEYLGGLSGREIAERQLAADVVARVQGITF